MIRRCRQNRLLLLAHRVVREIDSFATKPFELTKDGVLVPDHADANTAAQSAAPGGIAPGPALDAAWRCALGGRDARTEYSDCALN